jgi:hypothetical protein
MRNRFGRLTHGHNRVGKQTPEYRAWRGIIQRTTNKNAANYERFGGSGVTVSERWRKFENFLADVGSRSSPRHSIGRIFDIMPYGRDFAFWQTRREQRMHKLAHHFFEGKVKGWSDRRLNAIAKFITKTIAKVPDTEPTDFRILELLYRQPEQTIDCGDMDAIAA